LENHDFNKYSGIRDGDKKAFDHLFECYYEPLCRYVASIIHDHDTAEDLIQDLFATIWVNRKRLRIHSSIRSYLYRSAYHSSMDYLKHTEIQRQYQKRALIPGPLSFDDSMIVAEMQEELKRSIEQLPEQCRNIFRLSRDENLKYKEIAARLQISENTVDTQIRRALKKLKNDLKNYLIPVLIVLFLST